MARDAFGSLILPEHTPAAATVLFLHGSGAEGRDASRFEATTLCRAGYAALIYDKRGVGQSTGDWRQASFEDLAADAAAGLDWLAARPEIDAEHIGIYGHSQGATIAPLVAARSTHVGFIIAGAGAIGSTADVERYSLRSTVNHGVHSEAERRRPTRTSTASSGQALPGAVWRRSSPMHRTTPTGRGTFRCRLPIPTIGGFSGDRRL
jgi:predicted alpha/beta hydrolase